MAEGRRISFDKHVHFAKREKVLDNDRHVVYVGSSGAYLFHQSGSRISIEDEFKLQGYFYEKARLKNGPSPFLKPHKIITNYIDDNQQFAKGILMEWPRGIMTSSPH